MHLFVRAAPALSFAGAVVTLAAWGAGPLRLPGVAAGILAAVLAACGRSFPAACLGALAASASFAAQMLWGFCPDCAAAAAQFALGGVLCGLAAGRRERLAFLVVLCAACLATGAAWAARRGGLVAPGEPAAIQTALSVPEEHAAAQADGPALPEKRPGPAMDTRTVKEQGAEGRKAELYFSPWCRPCGEAVAAWVYRDPEGRLWLPVAVPERALAEGAKELRGLGYRGAVAVAPASPSGKLPCLRLPDGALVDGSREVLRAVSVLGRQETRALQDNP